MSIQLVKQYHSDLEKIIRYGGTKKETAIRGAFQNLLNEYCKHKNLLLIPELDYKTALGKIVRPDGTVKDMLRLDWGYWESKDIFDNLDEEVNKKFEKGYPQDNIIFEDADTAILYQGSKPTLRIPMRDAGALDELLKTFLAYERPEVRSFRQAIEQFKQHIPAIVNVLRETIDNESITNLAFQQARIQFLEVCRKYINSAVKADDVREMLIQHILTEEIFLTIFEESQFHSENNIARELKKVEDTFFTGTVKRSTLEEVRPYYGYIKAQAAAIADHHEKQNFLKIIYENFYKAYNPKGADRLGVVYTPNEIVRFMIQSTDYLLGKHFGRMLGDRGVEILDPATGTGTYIAELIDYLPKEQIRYKYLNEIHANEVSILPYYIANLNIEYTYKQRVGKYEEFKNICFVDTLDNTAGIGYAGKQGELFGISVENAERIQRQNERKISVVIGNPPYNANQQNENDNNKNREYKEIDKRIKATFIKNSTAQKTKVYDMYARFYRWAMDRLNDRGIIAFITNRSFIDSRTFDGFRKCIETDFSYCYIIDTQSDVRANPRISGTMHNVFGIQTGVALMFLIKDSATENQKCQIKYISLPDEWKKEEKLQWLTENPIEKISFEIVRPDQNNNWINIADENGFNDLVPLLTIPDKKIEGIFKLNTNGVNTARDEWVFDFDKGNLTNKIKYFISTYNQSKEVNKLDYSIKWSAGLKNYFKRKNTFLFEPAHITKYLYRPFVLKNYYSEKGFSDRLTSNHYSLFGKKLNYFNKIISISGLGSSKCFSVLGVNTIFSFDLLEKTQCFSLYYYDESSSCKENVTDWALSKFNSYYGIYITKEDIFYYVYAVLYNPKYKEKYKLNLKNNFPHIPLYRDFFQWSQWGKQLMDLHINYEAVDLYPLQEKHIVKENPKPKLKAIKESGSIEIDESTILTEIPKEAWEYKLGNRSALEWVLDQYKESKPKDPTIAEKFNTYRFADYKTSVIDLLKRVCQVSIETVKIQLEMQGTGE
ncbi:N-6 DNA methylase [Cytophagaceae bacterium YF14B1]|uniref:site-specific DNA-methyltransferase (adenine-specific) n=1 Tax=Xanthocytophaga flava TaxID=3048013 RepID=A0AAE3U873_9BACT|nr:type ISP restriction/modification enzyme [Xanthocytophaga flavus]MDJ1483121.1 N-6 DNA methylase [Xanthocytophaga flavus]